jgi:transposase-like protein
MLCRRINDIFGWKLYYYVLGDLFISTSLIRRKKMSEKKRKKFRAEEIIVILKKHLLEKKAVSDICDEHGVHPTMFYRWQEKLFLEGVSVFEKKEEKLSVRMSRKMTELEDKLQRKNEVLSELMEEHLALKKSLGES